MGSHHQSLSLIFEEREISALPLSAQRPDLSTKSNTLFSSKRKQKFDAYVDGLVGLLNSAVSAKLQLHLLMGMKRPRKSFCDGKEVLPDVVRAEGWGNTLPDCLVPRVCRFCGNQAWLRWIAGALQ